MDLMNGQASSVNIGATVSEVRGSLVTMFLTLFSKLLNVTFGDI